MDILFTIYIIFFIVICGGAFTKRGQELQYEYFAFKSTQKYMHSRGLKWPPDEKRI